MGFRVWGFGVPVSSFRDQGFGSESFGVQGPGFRVSAFGFRVQGLGFRVSAFDFRVSGFGFRGKA